MQPDLGDVGEGGSSRDKVGSARDQIERLEGELSGSFDRHPDAEILRSQPGPGPVLAARVLAEFGDDPHRYADPKSRKNYAGTSPITKASGTRRVVLARVAVNKRLRNALYLQAFTALTCSPGSPRVLRRSLRPRRHRTTKRSRPSPTDSSASCTAAYGIAPSTTNNPPGRPNRLDRRPDPPRLPSQSKIKRSRGLDAGDGVLVEDRS